MLLNIRHCGCLRGFAARVYNEANLAHGWKQSWFTLSSTKLVPFSSLMESTPISSLMELPIRSDSYPAAKQSKNVRPASNFSGNRASSSKAGHIDSTAFLPTSRGDKDSDNRRRYFTDQPSARQEYSPLKNKTNITMFVEEEEEDWHRDPFSDHWSCDEEPVQHKKRHSCRKRFFSALSLLFCRPTMKKRRLRANNHQAKARYSWLELLPARRDGYIRLPEE